MLTYPDALARLATLALSPATERLPLAEAAGRVVAEDISLSGDQPPFDRSTMDGYALCLKPECSSYAVKGIVYAGQAIGAPAGRAGNAPWYTGNLLGTSVFAGRIGDILIAGGPGEMYPQIVQKVRDTVEATTAQVDQADAPSWTPGRLQRETSRLVGPALPRRFDHW